MSDRVRAIRGATTVPRDDADEVLSATAELLDDAIGGEAEECVD